MAVMFGPSDPCVRAPVVAGSFYPADPMECRGMVEQILARGGGVINREKSWMGGIVPHAGWICSGAIAGQTLACLAAQGPRDVVVVFGAVHRSPELASAALDSHARWAMPGGDARIALDLQPRLEEHRDLFITDSRHHDHEHAIEVIVPLIQGAFPGASILPIEVPVVESAEVIGRTTAQRIAEAGLRAVYLASSDLTHYGPDYRWTPAGFGPGAMSWAKQNDEPLLDLVRSLSAERIIPDARRRRSACGAGAIAAMLAACRWGGATAGHVLTHATSYETLASILPQRPENSVGYAAVVVG